MEILQRQTLPTEWDAFILIDDRLFCITNGKDIDTSGKKVLSKRNCIMVTVICNGLLKISV